MTRPMIVQPVIRVDAAGDGNFDAPRGGRKHRGIDYLCDPGTMVFSPTSGEVTKIGFPYSGDEEWRYVEITDDDESRHRLFYVRPVVNLGDYVHHSSVVGEAQNIPKRYPGQGMKAHVHYEIINADGEYINPEE